MTDPLLHPRTAEALSRFVAQPPHAMLIVAQPGAGKTTVARYLAAQLLEVAMDRLDTHPYFKHLVPADGKSISIEHVRGITHFLTLRTTGKQSARRVVLIEHAQALTLQAQNALLKTIEEPPAGTVLILTAPSEQSLLPTIRSRAQVLTLQSPKTSALKDYCKQAGYTDGAIAKAMLMSDGLPGLCSALLAGDASHPLVAAANRARDILQKNSFERLAMTDDLVADKQAWLDTLFMLERMAHISLQNRQASVTAIRRWHGILKAAHAAYARTLASAQIKLVALNFMLSV